MNRQRIGSVLAILVTAVVLAFAVKTGSDFYADDPVAVDSSSTTSPRSTPSTTAPTSPSPTVTTPGGRLVDQLNLPDTGAIVAYLGDASTAGEGAKPKQGYAVQVAKVLKWKASTIPGGRGSGYLTSGVSSYVRRVQAAKARLDVDLVVIAGSENDAKADPADVGAALPDLLDAARKKFTGARVLVVGPYPTTAEEAKANAGANAAGLPGIDNALAQACSQAGVPYLSPIAGEWLTDEPGPFLTDQGNLDDAGHEEFAQRIEQAFG